MKNVTVSVDDETYRRARVSAAERGRSVSAVVRDFLREYSAEPLKQETHAEKMQKLWAKIDAIPGRGGASDRLTREELYDEATRSSRW